jgi:hypothetical protein
MILFEVMEHYSHKRNAAKRDAISIFDRSPDSPIIAEYSPVFPPGIDEGSEPEFATDQSGSWRFIGRSQRTAQVFRSQQLVLMNTMGKFYRENGWQL